MLLYILATFCIAFTAAHSSVAESDTEELSWAPVHSVKATKVSLTYNLFEDFSAWKAKKSSRIDFNQGAVKLISKLRHSHYYRRPEKYEIRPETKENELNVLKCHSSHDFSYSHGLGLDEILPRLSEDKHYVPVGNETVDDGTLATKFEYNIADSEDDVRNTIWASYSDDNGWIPKKHEIKRFNAVLGSLMSHEIWTFSDYSTDDIDDDIFDISQYGCESSAVEHTADSEKITKELLFINPDNEKHVNHVFNHFKNKFNREYTLEDEHALRKSLFRENMRMIAAANRRNLTYKLGINEFSDWTPEELEMSLGGMPRPEGLEGTLPFPYTESDLNSELDKLPKTYDMRLLGLVSPVKYQGHCGCCWTFAATAATESNLARVNGGKVLSLSNQAIIDCAYEGLRTGGCRGGFDFAAYDFILKHGLPTEQEYGPYKSKEGYCNIGNMTKTYSIVGYTAVTKYSSNAMKVAAVNHGPLYISIRVSKEFHSYSSGIFYQAASECDPEERNHAVTLVGYGERDGDLYWILKNSWGESWGEDGYMLISAKDNVCGVASKPSYPVF